MDLDGPSMEPPEGVLPNFDNPPNANGVALAVLILYLTLSSFSAFLYGYVAIFHVKKFHISDILALAAFGLFIGDIWAYIRGYQLTGHFVHQWDIRFRVLLEWTMYELYGVSFYFLAVMSIKAAILLQWLRIFVPGGTSNKFFWLCHLFLVVDILFYLGLALNLIITSAPFEAHQNGQPKFGNKPHVGDIKGMVSAVINLFLDLTILALPLKVIWGLRMNMRRKMGISLVFLIGILGCGFAVARVISEIPLVRPGNTSEDFTYGISFSAAFGLGEITSGILVYCVPSVPKALKHLGFLDAVESVAGWIRMQIISHRAGDRCGKSGRGSRPRGPKKDHPGSVILQDLNLVQAPHPVFVRPQLYQYGKQSESQTAFLWPTPSAATKDLDFSQTGNQDRHRHREWAQGIGYNSCS